MKYHCFMECAIDLPPSFDFLECLNAHGWKSLKPFDWNAESGLLQRVESFGARRVGNLKIYVTGGQVVAETEVDVDKDDLVSRLRRMLQLDIPVNQFHAYCLTQTKLSQVPGRKQGRILRSPTLYEDVVKVIATTNTTWTQTKAMVARIVDSFGSPLPSDPTVHAFPTPEQIAGVSLEEFAGKAKMGYRNASVHRIATDIAEGKLDLEAWQNPSLPSAELTKMLLSLPGIGPYAASCLMIYLGRYDRVNVDSWARMMVGKELGRTVTDKEVHAFFEPYGEWKALAYHFYPWKEAEPEY